MIKGYAMTKKDRAPHQWSSRLQGIIQTWLKKSGVRFGCRTCGFPSSDENCSSWSTNQCKIRTATLISFPFIPDKKLEESHDRFDSGWWLEPWNLMTFHLLGISSSQLTKSYVSEGWLNHQPDDEATTFRTFRLHQRGQKGARWRDVLTLLAAEDFAGLELLRSTEDPTKTGVVGLMETSSKFLWFWSGTRPGKHTKNYGQSPFSMGKSTIPMGHFQ